MIDVSDEGPDEGGCVGSGLARASFLAVLGGPAVRSAAAVLLICGLICAQPARVRAETITRRHLDAGRVQFAGIDLNGDAIPDAITQDNIRKTTTCFFADARQSLTRVDPLALPEEERRLIPDVLTEQDLDGDEIRDLLLYNNEYLRKYAANEAVFARLLRSAIYLGQAKDTYRDLDGCSLTPEARTAIMAKAREIVLRNLP